MNPWAGVMVMGLGLIALLSCACVNPVCLASCRATMAWSNVEAPPPK